ncbi:MAG: hypothetical protein JWR84_4068 [Caulobacter sp.]|nr:hypothetical protein [Caulobacter sp.]
MTIDTTPRRARTVDEMQRLQGMLFVGEEIGASIGSFRPQPDDVVISPFGKCGTTWLQQTFHTLRTRGDMDFEDISEVTPWIEVAGACGQNLADPQRAAPRGFKSHLPWDAMPKGAKYVVSFRDPRDALMSMYHFFDGWFLEPGAVAFEDFAASRLASPGPDYWHHLITWWAQRDNPDVMLLTYEGMIAAPEATIRRLAAFSDIALDDDLLALTLRNSSREFMLQHKDRFEDPMMRRLSELRCNLPPGSDSAKVRPAGGPSLMSTALEAQLERVWQARVTPATGLADYAALRAALGDR